MGHIIEGNILSIVEFFMWHKPRLQKTAPCACAVLAVRPFPPSKHLAHVRFIIFVPVRTSRPTGTSMYQYQVPGYVSRGKTSLSPKLF